MKVTREERADALREFIGDEDEWVEETNFMSLSAGFYAGVQWILDKLNEPEETPTTMS